MSAVRGQGQGPSTRQKAEAFLAIFRRQLAVASLSAFRSDYLHVDLHAGCGWNEAAGCDGSPVLFLRAAESWEPRDRRVCAYFMEHNPEAAAALRGRLAGLRPSGAGGVFWQVVEGDNGAGLRAVAGGHPPDVVGTLLCDPNGIKSVPLADLGPFFGRFRRVDAVWQANLSLFRKLRGCKEHGMSGFERYPDVAGVVAEMRKANWWVRNPSRVAGEMLTTLYGTNAPPSLSLSLSRRLEFYPVQGEGHDADTGREILARLNRCEPAREDVFPEFRDPRYWR